ncbi:SURF1 family protein [Nocardioides sp.]|uniref:SURF1 family cytochrome oxidase biogenesis protein n=1 Tax=Nocardioides sp. TaxID=35761 RepID=UPI002728DF5D|nr:SURF1 family protein [Nocardioides sp.]MDO9455898.1 SURF1 family protein [Nocardioides sp.]
MGSYRFLLSRRWASFAVVVVLLAGLAWWLGEWQFGRLDDRQGRNEITRTNEARPPAPVDEVLAADRDVDERDEWRRVEATGTYDVDHTVIVRYRSDDDGAPGVDVVVPLVTDTGVSLVVDRGFMPTDARSLDVGDVPAPPTGEVTVVGWVRVNGTGSSTAVDDLSTRAISTDRIGDAIGRPVYDGFVDAVSEDGAPVPDLTPRTLPELDNGPHFFYGLQWWFFGVLAVFGFFYLAYDERKRGPRGERETGPKQPRPVKVRQTNVPAEYQRR